jgi:hypothetical protein
MPHINIPETLLNAMVIINAELAPAREKTLFEGKLLNMVIYVDKLIAGIIYYILIYWYDAV